jgi:hypothetical protein
VRARSTAWLDASLEQLTDEERAVLSAAAPLLRRLADS